MLGGWGVALGGPDPPFTPRVRGTLGLLILIAHHWSRGQLRRTAVFRVSFHRRCGMALAAVREPTTAEVDDFDSLANVFDWARISGHLTCPGSRAGSLLRLLAQADWHEAGIDDVANVSPDDFDRMLEDWVYCSGDINAEAEGVDFLEETMDATPGLILLGAARALHQACRIKCKLIRYQQFGRNSHGKTHIPTSPSPLTL